MVNQSWSTWSQHNFNRVHCFLPNIRLLFLIFHHPIISAFTLIHLVYSFLFLFFFVNSLSLLIPFSFFIHFGKLVLLIKSKNKIASAWAEFWWNNNISHESKFRLLEHTNTHRDTRDTGSHLIYRFSTV